MKVKVTTEVEAPDGATHYLGNLLDGPTWLKQKQIGAVGEHWFYWGDVRSNSWILLGYAKPHLAVEILQWNNNCKINGASK